MGGILPVEVVRKKGIDDFIRGYSPRKVDEKKNLVSTPNEFRLIFEKVNEFLDIDTVYQHDFNNLSVGNSWRGSLKSIDEVLSGEEISRFFRQSYCLSTHPRFEEGITYVIRSLIVNSYDAGNRRFTFDTQGLPQIAKYSFFEHCYNSDLISVDIKGDLGFDSLVRTRNANIAVDGDVGKWLLYDAQFVKIHISGEIGEVPGQRAKNTIFTVTRKEEVDKLIESVHKGESNGDPSGNIIIYENDKGEEEVVAHYGIHG